MVYDDDPDVLRQERINFIKTVLVGGLLVLLLFSGCFMFIEKTKKDNTLKYQCDTNPRLLYAEDCEDYQECLKKCQKRIKKNL